MSSSDTSYVEETPVVEVVFEHELESSEEPPMEEWSSLIFEIPEENMKRIQYAEDLYNPGSGEICTKYIPLSASSVYRHPYYNYPGVEDPGIKEALLDRIPKIIFADDGQELYLATCEEMGLCIIKSFYRQLLEKIVNLRYYGINPKMFRAIAISLKLNRIVQVLDLTDNWIDEDGCFHLGAMLVDNITLNELILSGCRIGPQGARRLFISLPINRALRKLDLSKNQLGDEGVEYLAKAVFQGADVCDINLSYNNLSAKSLLALVEVFETHNKFTHLNLSWNYIISPNAVYSLCSILSENLNFQALDLSWNSLSGRRVGNAIKMLFSNPKLSYLNLSNNKLAGPAITPIANGLVKAKGLDTLDLSYNPMTPADALNLVICLKERKVKLQKLLLNNVIVNLEFIEARSDILLLKYRRDAVITCGDIKTFFKPQGPDARELLFNRAEAICKKSKKNPIDIALVILEMFKLDKQPMATKEFTRAIRSRGALLDDDLIDEMCNAFAGARTEKSKTISLAAMVDYINRKWPDRRLPPTPPEPEPEPPKKAKKKGKKKK